MALYKPSKHYKAKAAQILHGLRVAINAYSVAGGFGPAVITGWARPMNPDNPSFHAKEPPQADDYRCNDKPLRWRRGVIRIIQAFQCIDSHVQYQIHGKGKNIHIHLEYDTGDPV